MSDKSNPIGAHVNAENLSFTSASVKSRLEVARDDLLGEFAKINKVNGYRTDVKDCVGAIRFPDLIQVFPEIGLVITQVQYTPINDACSAFDATAKVIVQGAVWKDTTTKNYSRELQTATDALAQDMGKVIADFFTSKINTNDHRWNVVKRDGWKIDSFTDLGQKGNVGVVFATFSIHLRNMGQNLD